MTDSYLIDAIVKGISSKGHSLELYFKSCQISSHYFEHAFNCPRFITLNVEKPSHTFGLECRECELLIIFI